MQHERIPESAAVAEEREKSDAVWRATTPEEPWFRTRRGESVTGAIRPKKNPERDIRNRRKENGVSGREDAGESG